MAPCAALLTACNPAAKGAAGGSPAGNGDATMATRHNPNTGNNISLLGYGMMPSASPAHRQGCSPCSAA